MPLCKICATIDFTALPQRRDKNLNVRTTELYPHNHDIFLYTVREDHSAASEVNLIEHCKSMEALEASAKICNVCELIKNCVDATLTNLHKAREMDFKSYKVSGYQFLLQPHEGVEGFQVLGFHPNFLHGSSPDRKEYLVMGGVRLCVENESPLKSIFKGHKIISSPVSTECQTKIRGWIKECSEKHNHQRNFKTLLPTRVLDIQNKGSRVVLWETKDVEGEYAALSHCWGGSMPFTLNRNTFKELITGVNTNNLPRSFQDAIWIAFQLRIRYLWIDSLCILQDDADDWAHESERMTEVYQNSFLTISASCASSSADGFLGNRPQSIYTPIQISDATSSGLSGEAFAFTILPRHALNELLYIELADEPLSERGWALQERHLSHRTLHFTHSQVHFECDKGFYSEDGREEHATGYLLQKNRPKNGIKAVSNWRSWLDIVQQYSQRKLTMEDDKLPALAGLAKHFAKDQTSSKEFILPNDRYLAGLWRDNMMLGLMWSVETGYDGPRRQPQKYRAPTWSWAHVDAPVSFSYIYCKTELVIIEDAHTDLDTPQSPYGKVTGGWICLHALRIRPMGFGSAGLLRFDEDGVKFYIYVTWDVDEYHLLENDKVADLVKGETELFAVPLAWDNGLGDDSDNIFGPFFIVVKEVKRQVTAYQTLPHFERVGAGVAQWAGDRMGLKRLIGENWMVAKETGNLEKFILL